MLSEEINEMFQCDDIEIDDALDAAMQIDMEDSNYIGPLWEDDLGIDYVDYFDDCFDY